MENRNKKTSETTPHKKPSSFNSNQNKWAAFSLAILSLIVFTIYYKTTKFELLFNWDDPGYVTDNQDIKKLSWENIKLLFTHFYVGNYQPVTMLFYAIEYKLGQGKASIFHFSNILFHIINTYLVFIFIKKISPKNVIVALITAAFFAIHPMHVESVAWISESKDIWYTLFFLLSLIMYCNYLDKKNIKYLFYTGIFFILSCLSKSAAVILPFILLLLDYYLDRKINWKILIEKLPFFAISLVIGLVAIQSQEVATQPLAAQLSPLEHVSIIAYSFISYILKAFIPHNLSAIYPYPIELGKTLPFMYYLSILLTGLLLYFVWYSKKWGKTILFGFLFFIVTIILVLQFLQVGVATMADRYTYIPYIGVFFIIGKLFEYLTEPKNSHLNNYKKMTSVLLLVGLITFTGLADSRTKVWKNDDTLFSDVISKHPQCNIAYLNRANYYLKYYGTNANVDNSVRTAYTNQAISDFNNALKLKLTYTDSVKVYYSLGTAQYYLGNYHEAIKDFDKTIKVDPNYRSAYNNRGGTKFLLKDYEGALSDYSKVIELDSNDAVAYFNRAQTKSGLNDLKGAISDYDNAIAIDINYANAYCNKVIIKNGLQDFNGAIKDMNVAINLDSNNPLYYNLRGFAKHMLQDYQGALNDYNKAIQLNPQDANAISNRDIVLQILKK